MHSFLKSFYIGVVVLITISQCKKETTENNQNSFDSDKSDFLIENSYPHSINSFTEGLFISQNGAVYESTGAPDDIPSTESTYGILNLNDGNIKVKAKLDKKIFFGEGIAYCKGKIFQLTYKNKTGFIYDASSHVKLGSFNYESDEGWGLTNINDDCLIMSDGTNVLTFFDPDNYTVKKKLHVKENGQPLTFLNELEYVDGYVFANIYTTNYIVKIDSKTGEVVKKYDLTKLFLKTKQVYPGLMEMNGIAYNPKNKSFLVTGKMWPNVYQIKLID